MMTLMTILFLTLFLSVLSSLNPAKMSILMILMSAAVTYLMSLIGGSNWFPLLFYLLFMGGILVVFMILSSIMPNEKFKKNKMNLVMVTMMAIVLATPTLMNTNISNQMKWFVQTSTNIYIMILIIALYFFSFILIMTSTKSNLRIMTCHKKKMVL